RLGERAGVGAVGAVLGGGGDVGGERGVEALGLVEVCVAGARGGMLEQLRLFALGALGGGGDQERALAELAAEVGLAAVELAVHLVAPRGERVDPGLDRVLPVAAGVDREAALPGVAVDVRV